MNVRTTTCILSLILAGLAGCSSSLVQSSKSVLKSPMSLVSSRASKPVAKILCLWEAAEGQGLDEKPARGFAGQIMFFTYGDPSPIKVDGTVRIYEYADYGESVDDPEPIHEFVFESTAWNMHRAEGTLGHSYNVFLPYVRKGSERVNCALRVEFEDRNGKKTSAPFTEISLSGKGGGSGRTPGRNFVTNSRNTPKVHDQRAKTTPVGSEKPKVSVAEQASEQLDTLTISLPK